MSDSTTRIDPQSGPATTARHPQNTNRRLRWGAGLIALAGFGVIANGLAMLYRALLSPGFEPGVTTLGGITSAELAGTNHELFHYINHLHVNVAGLLVAMGLGTVALAWFGIRRGDRWALATSLAMPAVFLVHSIPIHQTSAFTFDALTHLGPGFFWLPVFLIGCTVAALGLSTRNELSEGDGSRNPPE